MAKIATFYDHIVDISRQENMFVVDALKLARELGGTVVVQHVPKDIRRMLALAGIDSKEEEA